MDLLRNGRGQTLIQAVVGMALVGILVSVTVAVNSAQSRASLGLDQKLSALDFQRQVASLISSPSTCNTIFAAANLAGGSTTVLTFDPSQVTPKNPYVIQLNTIDGIKGDGTGKISPGLSQSLVIKNSGIHVDAISATTARLVINLDPSKEVRSVHDLSFILNLATQASGPNNTQINGCLGPAPVPPACVSPFVLNFDGTSWSCVAKATSPPPPPPPPSGLCTTIGGHPGLLYGGTQCCGSAQPIGNSGCGKLSQFIGGGTPGCMPYLMYCGTAQ